MTQIGVHVWTFEAVKEYEVFPRKLERMRSRTVLLNGARSHYQHVLLRNIHIYIYNYIESQVLPGFFCGKSVEDCLVMVWLRWLWLLLRSVKLRLWLLSNE